jgi:5-methylcytosine-specific restriction endonuclease McrA
MRTWSDLMKISDLNFYDIGSKIGLTGAVFSDNDETVYLCMFPTQPEPKKVVHLEMSLEDWKTFLQQIDAQEVEVLRRGKDGNLSKTILRKTQRLIEQRVSWSVYRRDGYRCRYCNAEGVPLTVDHLITWESGGPSIEDNLVAACRKCNKTRGETPYEQWLRDPYYQRVSQKLSEAQRAANIALIASLRLVARRMTERGER